MKKIKGISTGGGVVIGKPFIYRPVKPIVIYKEDSNADEEIQRFTEAAQQANQEVELMANHLKKMGKETESEIFDAQREFLEDDEYYGKIMETIKAESVNAEVAVERIENQIVEEFEALEDSYFRQRAIDVRDISIRLICILSDISLVSLRDIESPSIIVAHDLMPSDTALLNPEVVLAICTEGGTATSHTAILARGLSIPAVVGCGPLNIKPQHTLVVDGSAGTLIVDPKPHVISDIKKQITSQEGQKKYLTSRAALPAISKDKISVNILANIGVLAEAQRVGKSGAEGVGLLRTESLFFEEHNIPTEEEQYLTLCKIAESLPPKTPMTVRILDIGGDKPLPALESAIPTEQNPFLGVRGIRFLLVHPELLRSQLRAILRASVKRSMKVFFPLVSTIQEVRKLQDFVNTIMKELKAEGIPFDEEIERGVMIEVPSSALNISHFFKEVDFVSIGSNDLTQYTLAVDRTNEHLEEIADYLDPAVLQLIQEIITAGEKANKVVELCGEMAGDPLAIPILIGMGLRYFSMSLSRVPLAKELVRMLTVKQCHGLAHNCLKESSAQEVRKIAKAWCKKQFASLNIVE